MIEQMICDYLTLYGYNKPIITYISSTESCHITIGFEYNTDESSTRIKEQKMVSLWDIVANIYNSNLK